MDHEHGVDAGDNVVIRRQLKRRSVRADQNARAGGGRAAIADCRIAITRRAMSRQIPCRATMPALTWTSERTGSGCDAIARR